MLEGIKKPDGMSYQQFYDSLIKLIHKTAPSIGFKVQYWNMGESASLVYTLNIISLILSSIVLITVLLCNFRNRGFSKRPSFRLSGSIALADIIHSVMMIIMHEPSTIDNMTELQLRISWFFVMGSLFASLFLTDCIALQLHLTVILKKERLAKKLNPWYELIGWSMGFIVVHPILYIFDNMYWSKYLGVLAIFDTTFTAISLKIWAIYAWLLIGIVYCMGICVVVSIRLISMLRGTRRTLIHFQEGKISSKDSGNVVGHSNGMVGCVDEIKKAVMYHDSVGTEMGLREDEDCGGSLASKPLNNTLTFDTDWKMHGGGCSVLDESTRVNQIWPVSGNGDDMVGLATTNVTNQVPKYIIKRRRSAMLAIFRIMLYPIVPLITIVANPIFVSIKYPSYNFGMAVLALAASQGIIESVVFFMNPLLDPMWGKVFSYISQRVFAKKKQQPVASGEVGEFRVSFKEDLRLKGVGKVRERYEIGHSNLLV